MHGRLQTAIITVIALATLVTGASILSRENVRETSARLIEVAGNVRDDVRVVTAPAIETPTIDPTVGLTSSSPRSGAVPASRSMAAARTPTVSGRLASIPVAVGDRVRAGQVVARFDDRMLRLGVVAAKAAASRARADADVLRDRLDTVASGRRTLADTRSTLTATLGTLRSQRGTVAARLRALEDLIGLIPTATMQPRLPPSSETTGRPDPLVLATALRLALTRIDAGIAQVTGALARIETGEEQLASARNRLANAIEVLDIVAEARSLDVRLARSRLAAAVVTSPVDGIVVYAREPGAVAMVGSPLVRVRPDAPVVVDTYLTASQLAALRLGDDARITYDSAGDRRLHGRVTDVARSAAFPPTAFPTSVTHMTRTIRVSISLDRGGRPPAGIPVDVEITGSGTGNDEDKESR